MWEPWPFYSISITTSRRMQHLSGGHFLYVTSPEGSVSNPIQFSLFQATRHRRFVLLDVTHKRRAFNMCSKRRKWKCSIYYVSSDEKEFYIIYKERERERGEKKKWAFARVRCVSKWRPASCRAWCIHQSWLAEDATHFFSFKIKSM